MNGNRLQTAWLLATSYRAEYEAVFSDHPVPITATRAEVQALIETEGTRVGQCKLTPACPAGCRQAKDASGAASGCWPTFPLNGKPGTKAGCQPGDPAEPCGDAFDCMPETDQQAITRMLVNLRQGHRRLRVPAGHRGGRRSIAGCTTCAPARAASPGRSPSRPNMAPGCSWARPPASTATTPRSCLGQRLSQRRRGPEGRRRAHRGRLPRRRRVCDCSPSSVEGRNCLPWGVRDGLGKLRRSPFRRDSVWSDQRDDESRQRYVEMMLDTVPRGAWRTPTLRGVALTAPYMHDGALATLEDVVEHYDRGGSPEAPGMPLGPDAPAVPGRARSGRRWSSS